MTHNKININQEEKDLKRIVELINRNYKLFVITILIFIVFAFFVNKFSTPKYRITSSLLIKEESAPRTTGNMNEFLHSSLFGANQNFQNELFVLKSTPVIEQTIKNLDLTIVYLQKKGFRYVEAYDNIPFRIIYDKDHIQPINVRFHVKKLSDNTYEIEAESKEATFYLYNSNQIVYKKKKWSFIKTVKGNEHIQTPDLSFMIQKLDSRFFDPNEFSSYYFELKDLPNTIANLRRNVQIATVDRLATVIEISLVSKSYLKGEEILNELMDVYSKQNLERKNHTALITIEYIEKQLDEISESLNKAEDNLQSFRSSRQLLDISEQANGISQQYMDLQNQQAELMTRKRYYTYVSEYLEKNEDFSDMVVPASMGIPDQLLNSLMTDLMTAQSQRSNLIANKQERNPLVQKLTIQIENLKKTIQENISAIQKTNDISVDEMNKRIKKIESEISQLPKTQRQLGGIERKYRLNDAIYNYLLEKRAEAKITQASNLPDNIIIEPAEVDGFRPITPKKSLNYLIAFICGFIFPFVFLLLRIELRNKIEQDENIEKLTHFPTIGKIIHSSRKSNNIMIEYPKSNIAESYRALRTNIDYRFKDKPKKVIMVTSSIEGEGKSFNALNLATCYAQLDKEVIIVDFDLRKNSMLFGDSSESYSGLSNYLADSINLEDIVMDTPHPKLQYIPAGHIPPDPVELLASEKTKELIEELKNSYDIVILDTPPMAQVTDAYLLIDFADLIIVVSRYNYSNKKAFTFVLKDLEKKGINNAFVLMNDNRIYRDQYGYGYGYYKKKN